MAQGGIKTAPLLTEMIVDLNGMKKSMNEATNIAVQGANSISSKLSDMNSVGKSLSKFGSTMTKYVTTPILGVGVATGKMAIDFESNFAKVSTLLDENVVDYGSYKKEMLQGSSDMKIAIGDYSDAIYNSISAGVDQTKAIGFTTDAMKLAKGGFTDASKSVDILTTAINAYGLNAGDATMVSDLLITTQNLGKTTVDELASSMGKVIPTANAYNVGLKDVTTALADLTKNGIATAEATTYYNSMLNELGKSGTEADKVLREKLGKGFSELQKEGVPLTECLKVLKEDAENSGKSLADMFGSAEAAKAALTIMKDDGKEYNEILQQMENSAGATQAAFEKIDATPAEQMKGALNKLKNAGIQFGQSFIPVIEKGADKVGRFADALSGMSEEQINTIVNLGLLVAAVGPVTKAVGGTISAVSNLGGAFGSAAGALGAVGGTGLTGCLAALAPVALPVTAALGAVAAGAYAIHAHGELMNATILTTTDEMSWLQLAMADAHGIEVKTREELEALGLVHKEFSEEISPEFRQAVEESTEEINKMVLSVQEFGFDGVLTPAEFTVFQTKVSDFCNNAIDAIEAKKEESTQALKEMFTIDDGALDTSEQRVLQYLQSSYDQQVAKANQLKSEIAAIQAQAVLEKRALNDREVRDVESKLAQIKQLELESLGNNQEEIMYAKNEFAARVKTMELEEATALLQEKAQIRDSEIVQISAGYDTQIQLLQQHLAGANATEAEDFIIQIQKLNQQKVDKTKIQQDLYEEYVDIVKNGNSQAMQYMDEHTGEILSNADLECRNHLKKMQNKYDGLNQITKSGNYLLLDKETNKWKNVTVLTDEGTGEVIGAWQVMEDKIGASSEEVSEDVEEMAGKLGASYDYLGTAGMQYDATNDEVIDGAGQVVSALEDITNEADGTKTGIIKLNGVPVEVKVHKDGTISAIDEIKRSIDSIPSSKNVAVNVAAVGVQAALGAINSIPSRKFNGIDNVPYDGYHAVLHKNERVLTATENAAYNNTQPGPTAKEIASAVRDALVGVSVQMDRREMGYFVRSVDR